MTTARIRARRHTLAIAALLALGSLPSDPAHSAACTWIPAIGNWNVAANWSCGVVPRGPNADSASVVLGRTVIINDQESAGVLRSIFTLANAGTLQLDAFGLSLHSGGSTTNTGTINVGGSSTAALQASAGHNINNAGGVINISNGSVLNQFGSSITGGTINMAGTGKIVANGSSSNFLNAATFTGVLDLASAAGIERVAGGLTLDGTVNIGNNGILAPQGIQTIGGSGSIIFADASGNNRLNLEAGDLTLGSGIVVRGQTGVIGQQNFLGGAATLTNNGTIAADVAGGTITLTVNGTVTNNGTLTALNGGTLVLNNSIVGNLGSQITVGAGSTIVQGGVTLNGVITNAGTGSFRPSGSSLNFLNAATFTGVLDLASALGIEQVAGGLTLNGTVNIGNNSILAPRGTQTIDGSGTIIFADGSGNNRLNVEAGNLTLGSGIVVRGQTGFIGQQNFLGGAATLTNNGTIAADVAGGTITLTVNGTVTNNGTLTALNGGTLVLNNSIVGNPGSQITVGAGSTIVQGGVTLNGVITNAGTGSFRPNGLSSNFLNEATFTGVLDLASALGIEQVTGGLTLNGTVNIGNNSILAPRGTQTIDGSGTIIFADASGNNRLNLEAGNLTLGSGIVVRGDTGTIGQQNFLGGAATLTNNGTIAADVAGGVITLTVNGLTTNNGTLSALNGGILNLSSAVQGNTGSQIVAGAGSVVTQNGITISGDMNLTGAGSFRPSSSGSNFLSGVTLAGTLDMATATAVERIAGGLTLSDAVINIGANSVLAPQGTQAIGGSGTIIFADASGNNRLNVEAGNLTLASGITVRGGTGFIGQQAFAGGAATLTNQGLISADVLGRTISVGVAGAVINEGTMRAQNGGILQLNTGGGYDNSAGVLLADVGSSVFFNSATVTGGALNSIGTGVFKASSSSLNILNGVTLNGVLDMASAASTERITAGGMTLNGTINIGLNSILAPQGNQTIGGTGSIVFVGGSTSNRLNVEAGNLVLGPGVTVRGQNGVIGQQTFAGGTANLTNNGIINADAGGLISINVTGALINNGTLRAQFGNMSVQDNLTGIGVLRVDSDGAMTLANGGNSQGRLLMGAAGSAITIGTGNLTINNDYTNDAAGSGNSFNRRAGVTGTGQILAGGDVAQVITGANVTNGATTSATLTIGNVRVGANTFNYQIGNAGSTGPTLRGAIQTSVNGGNLTDTRLGGTGVTAANYNAGAPGANSGDLAVVFTAASAGALAPLTGQVLNLRSNFENIADQKLNIVLGSGAAAYNAAVGAATSPVTVANQRVGGSNSATVVVANTAPAGSFSEDLNVAIGGTLGPVSASGSVAGRLAGTNNTGTGAITVGVNTATAGAKTGTVTLDYQTAGAVAGLSNGLGVAGAGSQGVTVNGNVYLAAQPGFGTTNVVFANRHVGTAASQAVSIGNTLVAAGFQEGLSATSTLSGQATGGGSFTNLAAGGSSSAILAGIDTTSAGAKSGAVSVALTSVGSGTSGLADLSLGTQAVNVSGNVYRLAQPNTIAPIDFGNVLKDTTQTRTLSITNLAAADGFSEALNAAFGSFGGADAGRFSGAGSITGLLAGLNNNTSMVVTLNTSSTGAVTANVQVLLNSNGTAIGNGLGLTALPTQTINLDGFITGVVGTLAQASLTPTSVNFGKFREGAPVQTQVLTIGNTAIAPAEGLNANFGATTGTASNNGGTITSLAPGASNNTNMSVSLGGLATAGAKSGSVAVNFVSDGSFNGGVTTSLPSQTVNLSAAVYRLAQASVTPTLALAARRVGDSGSTGTLTIANSAAADGFSEGLRGTIGAAPVGFGVSGPATTGLIAAGGNTTRTVTLNTGTAGVFGGNIAVALASDGEGTSGFAEFGLPGQSTAVSGKVYNPAIGQLATTTVDFGVVRVGDSVVARNITVNNTATSSALDDTLRANLSGVSGPFSAPASVGGIAAGGSAAFAVGLSTTTAGAYSQDGSVRFLSQNPDMSDASAGADAGVKVLATINNLANADFDKLAGLGLLTQSGTNYVLDLGTIVMGSSVSSFLQIDNDVAGPADLLSGEFALGAVDDFTLTGWNPFADLAAGDAVGGLNISFLASSLGGVEDTVIFNGRGTNASDALGREQTRTLVIRANVVTDGGTVPEPGSLLLVLSAALGGLLARRRAAVRH